jgi:hypothetical protein
VRYPKILISTLAVGIAIALVLIFRVSKDIGDTRKTDNFAKYGWLIGSVENLKESFGGR